MGINLVTATNYENQTIHFNELANRIIYNKFWEELIACCQHTDGRTGRSIVEE
jgi:hypothetical protein